MIALITSLRIELKAFYIEHLIPVTDTISVGGITSVGKLFNAFILTDLTKNR